MNNLANVLAGLLAVLWAAPVAMAQTPSGAAAPPAANATSGHSTHGHAAHGTGGKAASTPVVTAPANAHAQKPGQGKPGTGGKGAAGAAGKEPAKPAEPAPAAEPPKGAAAEPPKGAAAEPPKGSVTGLPLPRWASLKSEDVNLRKGPGTRYPIEWVYRRHDLPVQIEREYDVWRLVEDQDGVKGWVHTANLTGRRSFVVKGSERVLHRSGTEDSSAVARLSPGVVGHIRACEVRAAWCEVQVGEFRGWLKREDMFGIYAVEAVP